MSESQAAGMESVTVTILGKDYRVACPEGEQESLLRAARFLDKRMREIREAGVSGHERIAVMAALNLSHEFLDVSDNAGEKSADLGQLDELIERIDREIAAYKS